MLCYYTIRKREQHLEQRKELKIMFYWFIFADGYRVCTRGFSRHEMQVEVRKHGKLISKTPG